MIKKKIALTFSIFIILSIGSFVVANNYNCEEDCNENYLGVCFDEDSIFYKCNMDKDMCIEQDFEIAKTIKFMEDNNIVILGSSSCGWCKKQLEEFGSFYNILIEKELYLDCMKEINREICSGISGTPSWMINGKVISSGYKPLVIINEEFK